MMKLKDEYIIQGDREPTPEELALARKIAAAQYPDDPMMQEALLTGPVGHSKSVQAALAAIRETTERASDSCSWPVGLEITNEFARGMACSCALNSSALRNNSHLKGEDHDAPSGKEAM